MYYTSHQIMYDVYDYFISKIEGSDIPIKLKPPSLVGIVQDDPFDHYIQELLSDHFPTLEILSTGNLTTPDLVLRDRSSGVIVGLEIKKLIQQKNGNDPRGLTIDYNSTIPCGTVLITVGNKTVDIPCYYLFTLLNPPSSKIVTLALINGDFLNYDFNLYKHAKTANISEYNHGPYGEGSVRHRAMYTYPNPLNSKLTPFFGKKTLVLKEQHCNELQLQKEVNTIISREDIYDNNFIFSIVNKLEPPSENPLTIEDIFKDCKKREHRGRKGHSMPHLEE